MVLAGSYCLSLQTPPIGRAVFDLLDLQQRPSALRRARYVDSIRYHRPLRAGTLLGCFLAVFAYSA